MKLYRVFIGFMLLLFIALSLIGCDDITEPESMDDPTDYSDYQLVWSDEFNQESTTLNSNYWNIETGYGNDGWGNDEWQLYTNSQENIRVENGNMVITAIWDSVGYTAPGKRDGSVTSARVNTMDKFDFKFGKVQARLKPPGTAGMWPAFWMLGSTYSSAGWPYCGEIDIMEMSPLLHDDKTTMFTLHWWDDVQDSYATYGTFKEFNESLTDDYHIFEVEWDEQRIVGRIDGITYFIKVIDPAAMDEFLRKFFLIFNVAVGGNLGGSPDDSTDWPQSMLVDWVRVYQREETTEPITTFGLFTDETEVDAGLQIGVDAEIYIWESTLTGGSIAPFEGSNVISWTTTGVGWFGGGISSNTPLDLSTFENGTLEFMIKIPANVSFKIGINDTQGTENFVDFPANQTAYGLVRDGEWGKVIIPISELKGNVELQLLSYEFMILEENGTQCSLAIDDIYWNGGGSTPSSVSFNAAVYNVEDQSAIVSVSDEAAANSNVIVEVGNGTETIDLEIYLDASGNGSADLNFGETNDNTNTIAVENGTSLTASYTDGSGNVRTATATVEGEATGSDIGVYTESHNDQMLSYSAIINSADWSGNSAAADEMSTAVTPVDGTYVLAVEFTDFGAGWGGISFDFGSGDISGMETLVLSLNKSDMSNLTSLGVKLEDNAGGNHEVNISDYTPVMSGDWAKYEFSLSTFAAVDLSDLKYLGLWNPRDSGTNLIFSTLYFDDIYLTGESDDPPPADAAGIYSETFLDPAFTYSTIINSADWSGNSAEPDEMSTAVSPVDGTYVLSANFTDLGAGWGGIAFDFGSQDMTGYSTFVIHIDKSQMSNLTNFGLKFEDNAGGNTEVNISAYTPTMVGNWMKYEIPISHFPAVNFADVKYLGLWNPSDSASSMIFGTLFFDNIYLTN